MATGYQREKTKYPGVFIVERGTSKLLYILYRKPGSRKLIEEKLGSPSNGWTPAKASLERAKRIEGKFSNAEKRGQERAAKDAQNNSLNLKNIWASYLGSKGEELRGVVTDKNRFENHIEPVLGNMTPWELSPMAVEQLRQKMSKTHSKGTVRNVLELLRRITNHGAKLGMYPKPDWTIEVPKIDPDSERIEVLTPEQFQKLNEVWDNYHNRQVANLHKLIGWTGMRPSEPLRLKWEDVDFDRGFLTKRKTKNNKTLQLRINDKALEVLLAQRELVGKSPKPMRQSPYVFPKSNGEMLQWASYKRHFKSIREAAGIPETYRPNYCLRDTIASMMLSDGATLDEVGYQLGHEPGSPMTRRYARFIPDAQKRIADRAESVLNIMLGNSNDTNLAEYGTET